MLEVGMKVRVKSLEALQKISREEATLRIGYQYMRPSMRALCGQLVTIKSITPDEYPLYSIIE